MLTRRISRRGALAVSGAAALTAACGGSKDGAKETKAPAEATSAPAAAGAASGQPQGKVGGTVRYPLVGVASGEPPTLFPYENLTYLAQHPGALHYSRLLRSVAAKDVAISDHTRLEGDI